MVIIFIGIVMFIVGVVCKYYRDDYKNYPALTVGYKTKYAMKDEHTWISANNYFAMMSFIDFVFSISFILVTKYLDINVPSLIYYVVIVLVLCGPAIFTEIYLRKINKNKL